MTKLRRQARSSFRLTHSIASVTEYQKGTPPVLREEGRLEGETWRRGEGMRAEKVTERGKGGAYKKVRGHTSWDITFQFPHSAAGIRLLGRDRKQSMEVIAMAFPEEHEKKLQFRGELCFLSRELQTLKPE